MTKRLKSLCVFCGSRHGQNPRHTDVARKLGAILAENGISLVYGGGSIGLMGELARAVHGAGGHVVGVIPRALATKELQYLDADEQIVTPNMHERKREMFERSDAVLTLPGGIGTLEELVEVLSWAYLGFHAKPIFALNTDGYWDRLLQLMQHMVGEGFADPRMDHFDHARSLLRSVDEVTQVVSAIDAALAYRSELKEEDTADWS